MLRLREKDTCSLAQDLLGCEFVVKQGSREVRAIIVETEAYLGLEDPACHSYHGKRTDRIKSMYKEGGHAYIYLIYGLHYCFNVVTRSADDPEAVLIRAVYLPGDDPRLYAGPAKLCKALGITKAQDGLDLMDKNSTLRLEKDPKLWNSLRKEYPIVARKRVGLTKAADKPYRYYFEGHPAVSKP